MSDGLLLVLALGATVLALGGVVWSGITHRRAAHYRFVAAFFVLLAVAIWRAEVLGRGLVFEGLAATVQRIHMVAVVLTFASVPFVVVTGVRLARGTPPGASERRPPHRRASTIFLLLVALTCVLGTVMTLLARPA